MKRILNNRPAPSMIVALVALFVAMGGLSYAAATIGSAQIKNNSIRSKDIRNNDVRSKDVRNGSLLRKDFKRGQLPAGAQGPKGERGATGSPGPSGSPAASMLMGRTTAPLSAIGGVEYLSPSGASAPGEFDSAAMSSPAAPTIVRDLAVRLSAPVTAPWSREFLVAVNGVDQTFGCTVPSGETTCTSGKATLAVPAGARIAIETSGPGAPGAAQAEFGYRATTP